MHTWVSSPCILKRVIFVRLLIKEAWVSLQPVYVGYVVDKATLRQVFLQSLTLYNVGN